MLGISHDLGHTPFGHDGETILSQELEAFGLGYEFKHTEYGGCIVESLFEELIEETDELYEGEGPNVELDPKLMATVELEIKKAVENHSEWYAYNVSEESIVQKCTRLADTISIFATDLSDLVRGKKTDGTPIVSKESVIEKLQKVLGDSEEKRISEIADALENGGSALVDLQGKMIEEAFRPGRGTSYGRNAVPKLTIIDEYKILDEIKSGYKIGENGELGDVVHEKMAISKMKFYFDYLMKADNIIPNSEFLNIMQNQLGAESREAAQEKFEKLFENYENGEASALEQVGKIVRDKDIIRNIEETANRIKQVELRDCPTLMSIFIVQNQIQYGEILKSEESKKVLGNDEIQKDGQKVSVKDAVSERFKKVLKLAYAAEKKDKKSLQYLEREPNDGGPKLKAKRSRNKVPKLVSNGKKVRFSPLVYAVFAVQQMENSDFENDNALISIAQSLGLNEMEMEEAFEVAMEEIYADGQERAKKPLMISLPLSENKAKAVTSAKKIPVGKNGFFMLAKSRAAKAQGKDLEKPNSPADIAAELQDEEAFNPEKHGEVTGAIKNAQKTISTPNKSHFFGKQSVTQKNVDDGSR